MPHSVHRSVDKLCLHGDAENLSLLRYSSITTTSNCDRRKCEVQVPVPTHEGTPLITFCFRNCYALGHSSDEKEPREIVSSMRSTIGWFVTFYAMAELTAYVVFKPFCSDLANFPRVIVQLQIPVYQNFWYCTTKNILVLSAFTCYRGDHSILKCILLNRIMRFLHQEKLTI